MKTIRLKPVRHDEPFCDDYRDLAAVRRYETEMRVHRAHVEGYVLSALDDRIDGAYRVSAKTARSGESWVVDIVDQSGNHDACSCPDFLGNDLGTCKHLEAVRRAITNVGELRRRYRLLDERPKVPTVCVASSRMRLLPVGPWNARALGRLGLIRDARRDALEVVDGAPLVPGWQRGLRIVHAAPVAAAFVRARRAIAERRRAIEQALRDGKLGLDVLNKPLFAYQNDGAAHLLAAGRALLADDMGLGKTAQAIAACKLLRRRGEASRVLGALVAAIYRDLLPAGRLPAAAHAVLATLHDLSAIDAHGVDVDSSIAARAVDDAELWVGRLGEAPSTGLDVVAAEQPVLVARRRASRVAGGGAGA